MRSPSAAHGETIHAARSLTAVLVLGIGGTAAAGDGLFEGLGDLPGGSTSSVARAVSADGSVIVRSRVVAEGTEAFRWTEKTGMVGLGDLEGGPLESIARAVSADGLIAVGSVHTGVSRAGQWTRFGSPIQLPEFTGGGIGGARASGVSADGSLIAGYDAGPNGTEAYRLDGSIVEPLGDLEGGDFRSLAFGISADGSTVVGWSRSAAGSEPFRWRAGVMIGLGTLDGGSVFGEACAASADGSVVVGWSDSADGLQAFRSVDDGPMEGLGDLAGGPFDSRALDVRDDGRVIVGWGRTERGREALWWTEADGPRRLHAVAEERGVLIPDGWLLSQATGLSADGRTVVGFGTNPQGDTEAWRLVLPPPACPGDVDGNAVVDFADVLQVLGVWGAVDVPEDLDGSGVVDFGDVLIVIGAWGACPV